MSISSMKASLLEFYKTRNFDAFFADSLQKKEDLTDLLEISLNYKEEKLAMIGSWVCTRLVETEKQIFQERQEDIFHFLESGKHQSSLRSWMKVLTFLEIAEKYHGLAIDLCTAAISNSDNKVALQVYSMQVLIPLVHKYPEILDEIDGLIELHSINKSSAYGASWRNFNKKTKKLR